MQKKSQPSGDLNPGYVQSRHMPREPHTNRDGIPLSYTVRQELQRFPYYKQWRSRAIVIDWPAIYKSVLG